MSKTLEAVPFYRISLAVVLAAIFLTLAACADADGDAVATACEDGGEVWTEYRLFMGRSDGGLEVVSDADWDAFLADTITPRFPDGLSVIDVAGQGTGPDGVLERERTKMLLVLAPLGGDALERINEIGAEYKRRFTQDAVLRVVTDACVAFK